MRSFIPIGILLISLLFFSCGSDTANAGGGKPTKGAVKAPKKAGKKGPKKNVKAGAAKKGKKATQSVPNSKSLLVIADKAGMEVGKIKLQTGFIEFQGGQLKSKVSSSGKTKYTNRKGKVVAKVNTYADEEKIKIKSEEGKLLWKVKWSDSELKIAQNEEMKGAFEFKKDEAVVKIEHEGKVLGKVTTTKGNSKVVIGKRIYKMNNDNGLVAGLVGIEQIPLQFRMMIIREMINQK